MQKGLQREKSMEKKTLTVKYHAENKAEKTAYRLMKAHSGEYCVSGLEIQEGECTGPEISDEIEVLLKTEENLATESYRIEKINEQSFEISASDQLGLIYGVGRFLHRGHEELQDEYCIPQRPVRGIYFATHFHNFYQDAPIEKVEEYMEELVLWGCNSISTWFDMHHFYGQEDPGAQDLLYRLKRIYRKAQEIGLKTSLNMLANEYYYGGPKELLAENSRRGPAIS